MSNLPSWDEVFIRQMYIAASKSKDPRTKIGALLVRDKDILSMGYNGFPRGVEDSEERYLNRELKHQIVMHAETNSVVGAARKGISTLDSTCYTQGVPCVSCMKTLIQAGISEIVCHKQWPNLIYDSNWVKSFNLADMLMKEVGVKLRFFDKELGVEGYLDGKIIKV